MITLDLQHHEQISKDISQQLLTKGITEQIVQHQSVQDMIYSYIEYYFILYKTTKIGKTLLTKAFEESYDTFVSAGADNTIQRLKKADVDILNPSADVLLLLDTVEVVAMVGDDHDLLLKEDA